MSLTPKRPIDDTEATLKILLVGNSNVGKSSLLLRFTEDQFLSDEVSATIGVDFKVKIISLNNKKYKLTIWDTAGQERFRTLTSTYYRGAQGVILVYDVSNRETFEQLNNWLVELSTYCPRTDIVKIIVGNKVDQEHIRVISRKEGEAYAHKTNALFTECSAKTRVGVEEVFEQLVQKILDTPDLLPRKTSTIQNGVNLSQAKPQPSAANCTC
ncbi:9695_t:CDS:2 [Paraglomus occultum]|uniref:9695_t:CDS:1 n=1 Tax=Paraglomus occultum TaxID=144539 RepID=A0A9N9AJV4_9GLOM|nr:9695_t:CDS:2 [Paraglomus occultum]